MRASFFTLSIKKTALEAIWKRADPSNKRWRYKKVLSLKLQIQSEGNPLRPTVAGALSIIENPQIIEKYEVFSLTRRKSIL